MPRRHPPGNPKVAVAYLRVSTEEQKLGPEAQRHAIAQWAAAEGVRVVAWFDDAGVSGGADIEDRPQLIEALFALRPHRAGLLVVAKRDRLARDVAVALRIERDALAKGARVASADGVGNGDAPADHFLRTVVDGAAEYERQMIIARTRGALQAKRRRGECTGHPPYGRALAPDRVHMVPAAGELAVIADVLRLRASGLSLRAVVAELAILHPRASRAGTPLQLTRVAAIARAAKETDEP